MSLKEQIEKAEDRPRKEEVVPEWCCTVYITTLASCEMDAWQASISTDGENKNLKNVKARLVAKCLEDKDGARQFSDNEAAALGMKSALVIDRLFDIASALNGIGEQEVKELAGNSESGPGDDSPSD